MATAGYSKAAWGEAGAAHLHHVGAYLIVLVKIAEHQQCVRPHLIWTPTHPWGQVICNLNNVGTEWENVNCLHGIALAVWSHPDTAGSQEFRFLLLYRCVLIATKIKCMCPQILLHLSSYRYHLITLSDKHTDSCWLERVNMHCPIHLQTWIECSFLMDVSVRACYWHWSHI